ncbi:MAG: 8-amino-7-oxononanoate synthase [Deltaproteobacteria bacterium]|nr:8-amino-7-oxononanoate synthase [Deltaproteobacteria bacterium]
MLPSLLPLEEELRRYLTELEAGDLDRQLSLASGIDFASNDYLGLRRDAEFRRRVLLRMEAEPELGAPASRLLRGHSAIHQRLEQRLATFKGSDSALLFSTGYQANLGVLTGLVGAQDRVLSDQLNHASIIDGLRLAGCKKVIFPHRDVAAVEGALATRHVGGRTFLVTESLFSMDGTIAPLDHYADLAQRFGAELIVDEAHATGLFGRRGSGLVERFGVEERVTATISTFGKAFGSFGACVAGSEVLIRTLLNRARSFIFTTAPPPLLLTAVESALDLMASQPERRRRVLELADRLRRGLRGWGIDSLPSEGPIVPVVLGSNARALAVAKRLQEKGLDVRAVRPPTVPEGTARLRISIHADHREEDLERLARELAAAVRAPDQEEMQAVSTASREIPKPRAVAS